LGDTFAEKKIVCRGKPDPEVVEGKVIHGTSAEMFQAQVALKVIC